MESVAERLASSTPHVKSARDQKIYESPRIDLSQSEALRHMTDNRECNKEQHPKFKEHPMTSHQLVFVFVPQRLS